MQQVGGWIGWQVVGVTCLSGLLCIFRPLTACQTAPCIYACCTAAVPQVVDKYGKIDVLVNNAAIQVGWAGGSQADSTECCSS